MREEILARARWLLEELQLPPAEAMDWLRDYYPELELEERARCLRQAAQPPAAAVTAEE
ncbi:hypothetical protein [Streptomyces tateyamensis]|uniref:hypothetical protein n=1 Tax=Streptomyces tateyamensis TaxID=565073 RepID=UPI0015E8BB69|nr:hypothetical protein [Streptomyces tateyamensis]